MSHRPFAPPRTRSLVRTSQCSRSAQQALHRAYELALPVLREPLVTPATANESAPVYTRRFVPQTLVGG
jgi:hypothetical protein